jgi:hypothetical protein
VWRYMAKGALRSPAVPAVEQFRKVVEQATRKLKNRIEQASEPLTKPRQITVLHSSSSTLVGLGFQFHELSLASGWFVGSDPGRCCRHRPAPHVPIVPMSVKAPGGIDAVHRDVVRAGICHLFDWMIFVPDIEHGWYTNSKHGTS